MPEYDIDPIHFPEDLVAGVELITPPLPLDEAEDLRQRMRLAIIELDGWFNFENDPIIDGLGWHINIDAGGGERELEIARFALGVDELGMLRRSGRGGSKYTSTQRHAFGVPLLRELAGPCGSERLLEAMDRFVHERAGDGKGYAANFERSRYLELRHYGVREFLGEASLIELIRPATEALQMDHASLYRAVRRMMAAFQIVRAWLDEVAPHLSMGTIEKSRVLHGCWEAPIVFEDEVAGGILWDGSALLWIDGIQRYSRVAAIYGVLAADWKEAVALMALDVAEDRRAARSARIANTPLSSAIDDLRRRLRKARHFAPIRLEPGAWWRNRKSHDNDEERPSDHS